MPHMDESMLDLFGEEIVVAGLDPLPGFGDPKVRALRQQLQRQTRSNACRHLAWAKTGAIARVSKDARRITFTAVEREHKTGDWVLGKVSPEVIEADNPIAHIEWSRSGLELVSFDCHGRPTVYCVQFALDRLRPQPAEFDEHDDCLGTVIGSHWLPLYPLHYKTPIIPPIARHDTKWAPTLRGHESDGVRHAIENKAALLYVTQSNLVKLVYPQEGQPWLQCVQSLGAQADHSHVLTHAAFGDECVADVNGRDRATTGSADLKFLYLATYDKLARLKLYKITIEWNLQAAGMVEKTDPATVSPQLSVDHVCTLSDCSSQLSESSNNLGYSPKYTKPDKHILSQLHVVTRSADTPDASRLSYILAIFVDCDAAPDEANSATSILRRWTIAHEPTQISDAFATLEQQSAIDPKPETVLSLSHLDDIAIDTFYLDVSAITWNDQLAFATNDGIVEFRDRETLALVTLETNDQLVSSIVQAGYGYSATIKCSEVAISNNGCMTVVLDGNGGLQINTMEYLAGWNAAQAEDYHVQAALLAVAREYAILISRNYAGDELLALIPTDVPLACRRFAVLYMYRVLLRSLDFTTDDPQKQSHRTMREHVSHKLMSAQVLLASRSPRSHDIPSKVAWIFLNVKVINASTAQTTASRETPQAAALIPLATPIKWVLDLLVVLLDDLFDMHRRWTPTSTVEDIIHMAEETSSPAIFIILCSPTRALFRFTFEFIKVYLGKLGQVVPTTLDQRAQINQMTTYFQSLPYKLAYLESLFHEIENSIRLTYKEAGYSPQQKNELEQAMFVNAEIPKVLFPLVTRLMSETLGSMQDKVDMSRLYFWDTTWLRIEPRGSAPDDKAIKYDVLTKCRLESDAVLRVCRRCGSFMDDAHSEANQPPIKPWIYVGQKLCVCLSYWRMLGTEESA